MIRPIYQYLSTFIVKSQSELASKAIASNLPLARDRQIPVPCNRINTRTGDLAACPELVEGIPYEQTNLCVQDRPRSLP